MTVNRFARQQTHQVPQTHHLPDRQNAFPMVFFRDVRADAGGNHDRMLDLEFRLMMESATNDHVENRVTHRQVHESANLYVAAVSRVER